MNHLQKLYEASKLVSVNNNLCRKLVSSLEAPITFDKRFNATSVPFSLFLVLTYKVVN